MASAIRSIEMEQQTRTVRLAQTVTFYKFVEVPMEEDVDLWLADHE